MIGLPGEHMVRAHLPEGGVIWIKGLLIARLGDEVRLIEGEGEIRWHETTGEYVKMKLYIPHWEWDTPFGVSGPDESDRYEEYFL